MPKSEGNSLYLKVLSVETFVSRPYLRDIKKPHNVLFETSWQMQMHVKNIAFKNKVEKR